MAIVAKIGNQQFEDLQTAFDVGGEIELLDNVVLNGTSLFVNEGKNVILNGGSFSITNSKTVICVKSNATFTMKSGTLESKTHACVSAQLNSDGATIIIDGGTLKSVEGAVITSKSKNAKIVVNGGDLYASDNAVIASNGTAGYGPATLSITGGTFTGEIKSAGYVACGVYWPMSGDVTISDGTFNITNGCAVLARAGSVTITGGTFNTTGNVDGYVGDSKNLVPCAAIVFDKKAGYPSLSEEAVIDVQGGTLNSEVPSVQAIGSANIVVDAAHVEGVSAPEGYVFSKSGKLVEAGSDEDDTAEVEDENESSSASHDGAGYPQYQQNLAAYVRRQRELQQYAYRMHNR